MKYADMGCCSPVAMDGEKPRPTKYTHERDWSLDGNRPILNQPADVKSASSNKPAETGLILRQPL